MCCSALLSIDIYSHALKLYCREASQRLIDMNGFVPFEHFRPANDDRDNPCPDEKVPPLGFLVRTRDPGH